MSSADLLQPTRESERLPALDVLRGLAILGVLAAYTIWNLGSPPREAWSAADRWIAQGMDLLVDRKFLTIFAWLFGIGVARQWRRWAAAGHDPLPLHLRRMSFLLGVGLLHGALLRNGDILAPYALMGIVLFPIRRFSTRTLVAIAVGLLAVPYLVQALQPLLGFTWPERPSPGGSYLAENLAWLRYWYVTNPLRSWPHVLAIMIAGLLTARASLPERAAVDRRLSRHVLAVSLPAALISRAAFDGLAEKWSAAAPPFSQRVALDALYQVSSWTLAVVYVALVFLISSRSAWAASLSPLRALGRTAFTNYLAQAAIVVPFCLLFGLFDRMSPVRGLWLAAVVAAVQAAASSSWLRSHENGPLERLWRAVTYGGALPIRRTPAAPAP